MLTQQHLESRGHQVVAVANGREALRAFQRQFFDVVLLDEEMPGLTGTEVLRAIREHEREHAHSIVIAMTGYNSEPDRERLLQAGFNSVIGKPFRLDMLEATLRSSLEKESSGAKQTASVAVSESPADELLNRVGGDKKLLRRMIQTFLRDSPQRLRDIRNAIQQKKGVQLGSLAHAFKGSLGIFGAEKAVQCCRRLQELGGRGSYAEATQVLDSLKEEIAQFEANLRVYAGQKGPPGPGVKSKTKRLNRESKRRTPYPD